MKASARVLVPALLLVAAPLAAADDFRWHAALAAGRSLEIKGVNGEIHAVAASGGEAVVTARKSARRSDPASVEIKVVEHAGGVTVCAVYPGALLRKNECKPGDGGMSSHDNDVTVDFDVQVPAGVRFAGRTVNGGVEIGELTAEAEAETVNGNVSVASRGVARASSVNGSVRATLGRADWQGALRLTTVNGSVEVELPADTSASVSASTVNGDIHTDFPITVQGRLVGRHLDGTIGSGGRELKIETVNGSIRLHKGK